MLDRNDIEAIRVLIRGGVRPSDTAVGTLLFDYEALLARVTALEAERDAAKGQARLGWERHAEKDRAYGDMIAQRDEWRQRWSDADDAARYARETWQTERAEIEERLSRHQHVVKTLLGAWPADAMRSMDSIHAYIKGVVDELVGAENCSPQHILNADAERAADLLADVLPKEIGRMDICARIHELKRQQQAAQHRAESWEKSFHNLNRSFSRKMSVANAHAFNLHDQVIRLEKREHAWRRVAADLQREAPPAGRLATPEEINRWDDAKAAYRKLAEQE